MIWGDKLTSGSISVSCRGAVQGEHRLALPRLVRDSLQLLTFNREELYDSCLRTIQDCLKFLLRSFFIDIKSMISDVKDSRGPNINEFRDHIRKTRVRSNDHKWLDIFLAKPSYPRFRGSSTFVRVYYSENGIVKMTDTRAVNYDPAELKATLLARKQDIRAIALCHESSSSVDRDMVDILASTFEVDTQFLRQHFDYKEFQFEPECPVKLKTKLMEEQKPSVRAWEMTGRWNPVRLPSESSGRFLRLQLEEDCVSIQSDRSTGMLLFVFYIQL
jgi:hypothetical protein